MSATATKPRPVASPVERLLLTAEEAADVLGVGRSTVYDLLRLGVLPSVKLGRSRRIPVSLLHRFVESLPIERGCE